MQPVLVGGDADLAVAGLGGDGVGYTPEVDVHYALAPGYGFGMVKLEVKSAVLLLGHAGAPSIQRLSEVPVK